MGPHPKVTGAPTPGTASHNPRIFHLSRRPNNPTTLPRVSQIENRKSQNFKQMPSPKHHRSAQASTESIPTWGWWVIGSFLFLILVTVLSVVGFFSALASAIGYGIGAIASLAAHRLGGSALLHPFHLRTGQPARLRRLRRQPRLRLDHHRLDYRPHLGARRVRNSQSQSLGLYQTDPSDQPDQSDLFPATSSSS